MPRCYGDTPAPRITPTHATMPMRGRQHILADADAGQITPSYRRAMPVRLSAVHAACRPRLKLHTLHAPQMAIHCWPCCIRSPRMWPGWSSPEHAVSPEVRHDATPGLPRHCRHFSRACRDASYCLSRCFRRYVLPPTTSSYAT